MTASPIIETIHLAKTYADGTCALRDATCALFQGEYIAIVGPSGSGKSTMLHILGFLDQQSSGTYRFHGIESGHISPREVARIRNEELGFVFQQFNLLPRDTVLENVYMPLYYSATPKRVCKERAERAIEEVGLAHRMHHVAYTLSGGEKQRVAIARALINNPSVIFADEPTGNLDTASGGVVLDMLGALNAKGHTVIIITHDSKVAQRTRRILEVHDGVLSEPVT
jgi:putative ABC transport system ATP-binding protein